jgi:molybdopterin-guanine dinucleotide biosynthesis protein A
VVAKAATELPSLDVPIVVEPNEPRHPLAGVVAAMSHAGARPVLALACDTPFLSPMLLRILAGSTKTTAVRSAGQLNPLIAIYQPGTLASLETSLAAGDSATDALEALDPEVIEAPETETFNVNTPEDLAEAESRLRRARS